MQWFIINRDMQVVSAPSTDIKNSLMIDDSGGNGGQTLSIVNNLVIGTYDFTVIPYHAEAKYITEGNYIAFKDKYGKTRLYTIISIDGDTEWSVHCEDIGMDLLNEMAESWDFIDAPKSLQELINLLLYDTGWELNINEVADVRLPIYYDSDTDTWLSRLGNIVGEFGGECDFEIDISSGKVTKQVLNIYEKIGSDLTNDIFITDINLISLSRHGTIEDVYTCIWPTGNNGLDIGPLSYDDGDFYTNVGDVRLYSRTGLAKWSRFRAFQENLDIDSKLGYINNHSSYNTDDRSVLLALALIDLKRNIDVKVSYQATLFDLKSDLGDVVKIADHSKNQELYLSARLVEVQNHYCKTGNDTGTLANYELVKPNVSRDVTKLLDNFGKELEDKTSSQNIMKTVNDDVNEKVDSIENDVIKIGNEGIVAKNTGISIINDDEITVFSGDSNGNLILNNIEAKSGTIGGIVIADNGLHTMSVDSMVTSEVYIFNDGKIICQEVGGGENRSTNLSEGIITLSSAGTASGSNPTKLIISPEAINFNYLDQSMGGLFMDMVGTIVNPLYIASEPATNYSADNKWIEFGPDVGASIHGERVLTSQNNQNIKFVQGTIIKSGGAGTSFVLFSHTEIQNMFGGVNIPVSSIVISVTNGDGVANGAHLDGTTYSGGNWYVVVDASLPSSWTLRINYLISVMI